MNADEEPVIIALSANAWESRQAWLPKEDQRQQRRADFATQHARVMRHENTTIIPASGVWVCLGAWEYGDFTEEEVQAGYPVEAILRECAPQPLIAWRVVNGQVSSGDVGHEPNLLLPEGETEFGFTDVVMGSNPTEALTGAQRLLRANKSRIDEAERRCIAAGHRTADSHQHDSSARCTCGARRVRFVQEGDV